MLDKQQNYSLDVSVQRDYNVYEEMLSTYSKVDQSLIHTAHIFRTK